MKTELPAEFLATADGHRADEILRSCVHCGFCNAACPTYRVTGDELDGPRGRIYLIKGLLETGDDAGVARRHLDRCLTCRACETICPSGVAYGELLEVGRERIEASRPAISVSAAARRCLKVVIPHPRRFRPWLHLGSAIRWLLPLRLRRSLPPLRKQHAAGTVRSALGRGARRVLVLQGCVQRLGTPQVNAALTTLLAARNVEVIHESAEGCCGSLRLHLGAREEALVDARRLIDALTPHLDTVDAIVSTASGCGVTVKDYPRLLAADPDYGPRAVAVAEKCVDVAEYLTGLAQQWARSGEFVRVAWQAPCTLQHGQRITGLVEALLTSAGYELVPVADADQCCGSAGTYSLLQPALAGELKRRKLDALSAGKPDVIASANVGCQMHLDTESPVPVRHWLELLS